MIPADFKRIAKAAAFALMAVPSVSHAEDWTFNGTIYLFAAETTAGIGNTETVLSFSDALDNLETAFMGTFEAIKGPWAFIADYMLTDLSFDSSTPGPLFSGAQVSVKTQVFSGFALYEVYDAPGTSVDLGGGLRWFDTETTLRLSAGTLPGETRGIDDSWTDPVVAARVRFDLGGNWTGAAAFDYGSFVNDRETWQVLLTANYEFAERWVARFGYRYLRVENDEDGRDFLFEQSGPVLGVSYRF